MGLCDDGLGLFQHFIPNIPKFHYSAKASLRAHHSIWQQKNIAQREK
jgi:hypothetical protein